MKNLLDKCLPRKLKFSLPSYDCQTVPEAGFAGLKNGVLLSRAESAGFNIFLTMDKGLQYQQNFDGRSISVLILRANSNRLHDLSPLIDRCKLVLANIQPGQVVRIGISPAPM